MHDEMAVHPDCSGMVPTEPVMDALQGMALLLRSTNERMAALEAEVRRLTKVTPSQASALNAAMRERATAVCQMHRAAGCEKAALSAIRRDVKRLCGISNTRELPRGDYTVAMKQIQMWDDYDVMIQIKRREAKKHG